ncbi:MAG: hypothetical protein WAT79_14045 [Saprospiraceae bacterium]
MKDHFTKSGISYLSRIILIFTAFWNFLTKGIKKIDGNQLGKGVMDAIRMTWKHGIIVILMLIPILLLMKMPQGRDLIHNMLNGEKVFEWYTYFRILCFLTMVVFTSYAIWAIPRFYQENENKNKSHKIKSTSGNFLRILSATPFLVYGIVFFLVDPRCETNVFFYWSSLILLGLIILTLCFHFRYGKYSVKSLIQIGVASSLFLPVGYPGLSKFMGNNELSILFLGNSLLFLGGLIYVIYLKWEAEFEENRNNEKTIEKLEDKGDGVYYWVCFFAAAIMLLFSFIIDMTYVTSVSLLTMIMGSLILGFNWLSYKYKTLEGKQQFMAFGGLVLLFCYLHYPESKPHSVYLVDKSEIGERPKLDDYMKKWFAHKDSLYAIKCPSGDCTPMPIYLIAGEGGGSRAGLWYSTFILEMDKLMNGSFSKQTFATSTISGSSVGASLLSKWYRVAKDLNMDRLKDKRTDALAIHFFTNNFVSGSVFDLFFQDVVRRLNYKPSRSGRNLRVQQEENAAFIKAMNNRTTKFMDMICPVEGMRGDKYVIDKQKVANYHFLPIQDLWLNKDSSYILDIPLNFFNTTHMPTGRQYSIAPVSFCFDSYMDGSLDLIKLLQDTNCNFNKNFDLALGTANNMSELFPFFSAYSYVDGLGHFMDGGGCDNSGAKTLQFIYQKLHQYLSTKDSNYIKRYPIEVIYISNGNPDDPQDVDNRKKPKNQILSLLGQAYAQPFKTITVEAIYGLQKKVESDNNRYFEASWSSYNHHKKCPKGCKDSIQTHFPTARSLNKENLDSIVFYAKKKAFEIHAKLKNNEKSPKPKSSCE